MMNVKVARVYSCYGEGLRKNFLWDLFNKLLSHKKINLMGIGDEIRNFIQVDDLILALKLFANSKIELKYIKVGNWNGIKIKDPAKLISNNLSFFMKRKINKFEFSGEKSSTNPFRINSNIQDLTSLGFEARVGFEEGVKRYCEWFANLYIDNKNTFS